MVNKLFFLLFSIITGNLYAGDFDHIKGVELLVTDSGSAIESKFGHSLIRLIDNDELWTNDLVVSFAANVEGEGTSLIKGVIGGYEVMAEIKTMYEFWDQYTLNEGRGFLRYPLRLNKFELENFLNSLQRFIDKPELSGDYKFFSNNCSTVVTKVFQDAGIIKKDDTHSIPITIESWINKHLYSPFLPIRTSGDNKIISKDISLNNIDSNDLAFSYLYGNYDFDFVMKIAKELKSRDIDLNDLFGLNNLPLRFYNLEAPLEDEDEIYSLSELKELSARRFLLSFSNNAFKDTARYFRQEILLASQNLLGLDYKYSDIVVKDNKIKWSVFEHKSTLGTEHTIDFKNFNISKNRTFRTRFNKFIELKGHSKLIVIKDKNTLKLYLLI